MIPDLSKELDLAKSVAAEMGKLQLSQFRGSLRVIRKTSKEFVSNVDMECQRLALKMISEKSSYPILSEEEKDLNIPENDLFWIIDPIDGTHNFIAGLPNFGVSIALASKEEFLLGVIYLPYFNEMYSAILGQGAFMNGQPINVSENEQLEKSLVTYDNQFYLNAESFKIYQKIVQHSFTTRILGSAVFDFSLIALGRADARVWNNTKIFDFAAGIVIVTEAGGKVTDFAGNKVTLSSQQIIASNGKIHSQLINIIKSSSDPET